MKFKWKYYTEKLLQFQGDAKKNIHSTLSRKNAINENVIFEEKRIANAFNILFVNVVIGLKLADDIPTATRSFGSYVQKLIK